ncbi:MAG: spermidine synthase [Limisphaerales bacterium]
MSQNADDKPTELTTGLRRFLYLTIFIAGAAILVVEILGAKMLSPFFGTSHFVWTAQIAVTLMSLSIGYWFGGWLVDRSPKLNLLYRCLLGAGVYLALTIPLCASVSLACLKMPLAVGSLFASLFLFFVPLTLLAVTGPFVVRIFTSDVASVGGNVGRISAISTIGSVVGTVLIGYVLIPLMPNSTTMFVVSGILIVLPLTFFLLWKSETKLPATAAVTVLAIIAGAVGVMNDGKVDTADWLEVDRVNSNFGLMQVMENSDGTRRDYLNDYLTQNTYDPETGQSTSLFTHMLHGLAKVYTRDTEDVLCIGMGIGIVPMLFAEEGSKVDVVEINDRIAGLAKRHFGLKPEKLNLTIGDGRYFVNACEKQYDAVILDAFLGDSSPSHLLSQEAFAQMKRVLLPEGVLVINCFGEFEPGKDFFTASLDKTLKSVFTSVRIHATGNGNVFFVASAAPELTQHREIDYDDAHTSVVWRMKNCMNGIKYTLPANGIVLTDDYNPVDFHDAENREGFRRDLARNMHEG